MPINTPSDRNATVNYAIDLLRAHQIRRENVFLHEQLKTCLKELTSLRVEVRELRVDHVTAVQDGIREVKSSIDINNGTVQTAFALANKHESRLNEQTEELATIQQSCSAMQIEMSNLKASSTKKHEKDHAQRAKLEDQLQTMRLNSESTTAAQEQQAQRFLESIENIHSILVGKADIAAVEALEIRLTDNRHHAPARTYALDSVSRVSDTFGDLRQPGKL